MSLVVIPRKVNTLDLNSPKWEIDIRNPRKFTNSADLTYSDILVHESVYRSVRDNYLIPLGKYSSFLSCQGKGLLEDLNLHMRGVDIQELLDQELQNIISLIKTK